MTVRIVRIQSRNPVVALALLAVILAVLAFALSAVLAVAAGAAVLGGAGYAVRRLTGRGVLRGPDAAPIRQLDPAKEVFPDATRPPDRLR